MKKYIIALALLALLFFLFRKGRKVYDKETGRFLGYFKEYFKDNNGINYVRFTNKQEVLYFPETWVTVKWL